MASDVDPFEVSYGYYEIPGHKRVGYDPFPSRSHTHKLYLDFAKRISEESKDPRLKVGCVIATKSGIVYPGYNGDEKGGSNKPKSLEPGESGFLHAEENAIIKFNPTIHPGSIMYLTHNPCEMCAKRIINTQAIEQVYYLEDYRTKDGVDLLRARGIGCDKLYFY